MPVTTFDIWIQTPDGRQARRTSHYFNPGFEADRGNAAVLLQYARMRRTFPVGSKIVTQGNITAVESAVMTVGPGNRRSAAA